MAATLFPARSHSCVSPPARGVGAPRMNARSAGPFGGETECLNSFQAQHPYLQPLIIDAVEAVIGNAHRFRHDRENILGYEAGIALRLPDIIECVEGQT